MGELRVLFDSSYNDARNLTVRLPANATKVELVVMMTGHGYDSEGCCEFLPTRHIFTFNNHAFTLDFMEPLDLEACFRPSEGVAPNGYGAWWYGRNGWCNGQDVKPRVLDVSSAFSLSRDEDSHDNEYVATYAG